MEAAADEDFLSCTWVIFHVPEGRYLVKILLNGVDGLTSNKK